MIKTLSKNRGSHLLFLDHNQLGLLGFDLSDSAPKQVAIEIDPKTRVLTLKKASAGKQDHP